MSSTKNISIKKYSVELRLRFLIKALTNGKPDWKFLEDETGVQAEKWRNFHRGATKASVEMIESACANWPEYALWLMTGVCDSKNGHTNPNYCLDFPGGRFGERESNTISAIKYLREFTSNVQYIWEKNIEAIQRNKGSELTWEDVARMFDPAINFSISAYHGSKLVFDEKTREDYLKYVEKIVREKEIEYMENECLEEQKIQH